MLDLFGSAPEPSGNITRDAPDRIVGDEEGTVVLGRVVAALVEGEAGHRSAGAGAARMGVGGFVGSGVVRSDDRARVLPCRGSRRGSG